MKTMFYKTDKGLLVSPYNLQKQHDLIKFENNPLSLDLVCTLDLSKIPEDIAYLIRISSYIYPTWNHPYSEYKSGFSLQTLKNLHFTSSSELDFNNWIVSESLDLDLYLVNNFQYFIKYTTKINFIN